MALPNMTRLLPTRHTHTPNGTNDYVVTASTLIPFGKYKGKPHAYLVNHPVTCGPYIVWLMKTDPKFAAPTKEWLLSLGYPGP